MTSHAPAGTPRIRTTCWVSRLPPTIVTNATRIPALPSRVRPSATPVFEKKLRVSGTSYAAFSDFWSAPIPPVAAHSAASAPIVSRPGRVWPRTACSWGASWRGDVRRQVVARPRP